MASLTIRKLDESLMSTLRMRVVQRSHFMQDEARAILRAVPAQPSG
ncbi:MAG: hypothetical protein NTV97_36315 [Alphaproteobacteria bacterium]|nr:hypothetical protein [Alphaproteobacteria bacterium]